MDIVLGVSMTPHAVRMVLVEGEKADGATVDRDSLDADGAGSVERVVTAILGTRDSVVEGGHHLRSTGVAWTDHATAARLRQALVAHGLDDVMLVSELHAASALAQAVGQTVGCERTALLFLERDTATLAVVRTRDGAVVRVDSRRLQPAGASTEIRDMVAGLRTAAEPPRAVFLVGSGFDIAALKPQIAEWAALPVHAPEDGELALARGAALASGAAPRLEAATVGLAPGPATGTVGIEHTVTSAGATQRAAAGYMAPLGYSAVADDDIPEFGAPAQDEPRVEDPGESDCPSGRPFLLVGSALSTVFVVGVAALAIALAVVVRPAVDQRPDPAVNAVTPSGQVSAPVTRVPDTPETIQAPIPVVQQVPRAGFVAPEVVAPPAPEAAPAPAPEAVPAPAPAAPVTVTAGPAPAAPAPGAAPIFLPVPIPVPGSPLLPSIVRSPVLDEPVLSEPSDSPTDASDTTAIITPPTTTPPTTTPPTTTPPTTTQPTTTQPTTTPPTQESSPAPSATTSPSTQAPSTTAEVAAAQPASETNPGGSTSNGFPVSEIPLAPSASSD